MKIAYITSCFSSPSHTFIRREIDQLESENLHVTLYGIRKDTTGDVDWQDRTTYIYPLNAVSTFFNIAKTWLSQPVRFSRGLWRSFFSPELSLKRRSKMLYHYLISTNLAERVKKDGITHIHAHFMNVSSSIAMYAAHHANIPYSITVHSAGTYGTPHILGIPQKLNEAQHLVMISHYNIEYFEQFEPCQHKSTVVRCGMDLDNFPFSPKDINSTSPLILAVGRFVEKKGFKYLIEATNQLNQEGIPIRLRIIGSGPLENELRSIAQINPNIEFAGRQTSSQVYEHMLESDFVIVPSVTSATGEMEGLPVVIMEAMATGRLVISTKHSGIPEIVKPEESGYLVKEKSSNELANAIKVALSTPPEIRAKIANSARRLVENDFNISTVARQRKTLFEKLANNTSEQ